MSVYVDDLFPTPDGWGPGNRFRQAAHLFGHNAAVLHSFAARIGLRRSWAQGGPGTGRMLHYDLTPGKRRAAVRAGAIELGRHAAREMIASKQKEARASWPEGKEKLSCDPAPPTST